MGIETMNIDSSTSVVPRSSPSSSPSVIWQVLAAVLLLTIGTLGCADSGSGGPAAAPTSQPQAAPMSPSASSMLDRAPEPVRKAYLHDYPNAKVTRVQHRLHPDNMVHYTITSVDAKGNRHEAEYRADGVRMTPK